jgi:hypothetical protein
MDDKTRLGDGFEKPVAGAPENTGSSSTRQNNTDEINIADYLRVILKHRRMIFWFCAAD